MLPAGLLAVTAALQSTLWCVFAFSHFYDCFFVQHVPVQRRTATCGRISYELFMRQASSLNARSFCIQNCVRFRFFTFFCSYAMKSDRERRASSKQHHSMQSPWETSVSGHALDTVLLAQELEEMA